MARENPQRAAVRWNFLDIEKRHAVAGKNLFGRIKRKIGEKNKKNVLNAINQSIKPGQRIFLGVTNVLDPRVETAEEVRDLILEAAETIPVGQLGSTDDCGFSPFADDTSTSRDIAFAKIKARIDGTKLAEEVMSKKRVFFQS